MGLAWTTRPRTKYLHRFFLQREPKEQVLGLFIANTIIEQHGGEIKVKSKVGQGTLFQIKIPTKAPVKREEGS